ncbi:MAG: pseudouridine synthase [Pseudomonadota bacterium]
MTAPVGWDGQMVKPGDDRERIAKRLARAGIASRREAERMIEAGRVRVNGKRLDTPAFTVSTRDAIEVDGKPLTAKEPPRLWRYHKPPGLVTTHRDERGRKTVFDTLPDYLPRVISVGRLDLTSEGLLLLTNDGELARQLELPSTGWSRRYRARAYGKTTQDALDRLKDGIEIDGRQTGPIEATLESEKGDNVWVEVMIREGKNREVRRAMETLDLKVNRLIRTSYGPFQLLSLQRGAVDEVGRKQLRDQVGHLIDIPREQDRHKRKPPKRGTHASKKAKSDASPAARKAQKQNAKRPPPKKAQGGRHAGPPRKG